MCALVTGLQTGALPISGYSLRTANIEVRLELDPAPPPVWGDSDQLNQVVTNIIVNAQQAMMDVTTPRVLTIRSAYDDAAKEVTLTIADSGPGIPEEIQSRIFEPFFTTKDIGEIGRASGRERVCKYVEISVVAVTLKK